MVNTEIEKKANSALEETDLGGIIPINIVAVARFFGFSVYESTLNDNLSGLIMVDKEPLKGYASNKIIVVNARHSTKRKRFTVAHELGHYFLNEKAQQCFAHRDIAGAYNREERDANQFASVILMPESKVRECVKNHTFAGILELVEFIADTFNVSKEAAQVRLQKLNII